MAVMFYGLLQISSVNAQSPVNRPLKITGDGVLSLATNEGTITITGGTGKYEGATGPIEFEGAGTLEGTELHYTYAGEGWIKY
jgi:hypothetical protein